MSGQNLEAEKSRQEYLQAIEKLKNDLKAQIQATNDQSKSHEALINKKDEEINQVKVRLAEYEEDVSGQISQYREKINGMLGSLDGKEADLQQKEMLMSAAQRKIEEEKKRQEELNEKLVAEAGEREQLQE